MRFSDGPHPVDVIVDEEQFPWPLPGIINGGIPGGYYEKVAEDEQPAKIPGGNSILIATYTWRRKES
jgi:hypothetical protein